MSLDGKVIGNYKAGPFPRALAFDGENMWVANSGDNSVTKLNLDGELLDMIRIGPPGTTPSAMAPE